MVLGKWKAWYKDKLVGPGVDVGGLYVSGYLILADEAVVFVLVC